MQRRTWDELRYLQSLHRAPIFIAGDLFQNYSNSPWLVNNVLVWLEGLDIYAIPGNHDLPHHSIANIQRSSYWTLVEAGAIKNLTVGGCQEIGNVRIWPFPSGVEVIKPSPCNDLCLNVALIHDFIWTEKTGRKDAPEEKRFGKYLPKLKGYHAAFFGDNHQHFVLRPEGKCIVFNCGTLLRRHSNERELKPVAGLLHENGEVSKHFLSTTLDKFVEGAELSSEFESIFEIDLSEYAESLSYLSQEKYVFASVVRWFLQNNEVPKRMKEILLRAIAKKGK